MTIKDIQKKYGEGVVFDASLLLDTPPSIISTTPNLDMGLSGGIPEGALTILSGEAKCGKSSLCLQIIKNAQQKYKKKAFYIDVEHRLKATNLRGIQGLDVSPEVFQVIRSSKDKILGAEELLDIATELIKNEPNSIVVLDSASALCNLKEMVDDITGQTRSLGPKLLSAFCRKNAPYISVNKITLIIIQHLIANTSGYGSPFMEDGGAKIKYQADVKLRATGVSKWMSGDTQIGQITTWHVLYSALGAPGNKVQSYLRYGQGMDCLWEKMSLACDLGVIKKGGAWYEFNGQKIQGQEKLYAALQDDVKMLKDLDKALGV